MVFANKNLIAEIHFANGGIFNRSTHSKMYNTITECNTNLPLSLIHFFKVEENADTKIATLAPLLLQVKK